jgi:hypothetical protein
MYVMYDIKKQKRYTKFAKKSFLYTKAISGLKALFKVNLARLFGPTITVDPTVSGNNSIV